MEADGSSAGYALDGAGEQVLAVVLLHVVASTDGVDPALDLVFSRQPVDEMENGGPVVHDLLDL